MQVFRSSTSPLLALAVCVALPAQAGINANVGLATDFVREGINQTHGHGSWQAGLTATHNSGLYLGGWVSNNDGNEYGHIESDAFAGYHANLSRYWSVDLSATYYQFQGNEALEDASYVEGGVKLLYANNWMLGYRYAPDHFNLGAPRQAFELGYTYHIGSFSIDSLVANYRYLDDYNGYDNQRRNNYLHFRLGVERTYNHWDYRLTVERTNLGKSYDAGTSIQFGIHRYFQIW